MIRVAAFSNWKRFHACRNVTAADILSIKAAELKTVIINLTGQKNSPEETELRLFSLKLKCPGSCDGADDSS